MPMCLARPKPHETKRETRGTASGPTTRSPTRQIIRHLAGQSLYDQRIA